MAVLVDGAHAPGMLAVDLDRLGADFFVGTLHKWCCAPRGTGVLHAAERWRPVLRPLVASWGEDEGFPLAFDDTGTEDPSAWLSAPRALRVLEGSGWTGCAGTTSSSPWPASSRSPRPCSVPAADLPARLGA